jgi:hypothetical protein
VISSRRSSKGCSGEGGVRGGDSRGGEGTLRACCCIISVLCGMLPHVTFATLVPVTQGEERTGRAPAINCHCDEHDTGCNQDLLPQLLSSCGRGSSTAAVQLLNRSWWQAL